MLRTLILLSIAILFSTEISGQLIQKVEVVPYAVGCDIEETLEQAVQCSEGMLLGYFLQQVDTVACPTSDTSRHVSVVMDVLEDGNYTVKVRSGDMRPSCLSYFEEKGFQMPHDIKLFPALLNKKDVAFKKRLSFYYPSWDTSLMKYDSVSGAVYIPEEMPRFRGCEDMIGGNEDKKTCATNLLLQFIYKTLRYPVKARKNSVEGMVVVQFVVDDDGYVIDPSIVKDIGGGCGEASLDVIRKMNKKNNPPFVPGKINGKPVKVKYTLPFRFRLH